MTRRGTLLLFVAALAVGAVAARAQAPPEGAVEASDPDDVALAARLDDDLSAVAVAVGACVQDGGAPHVCLCAARPALAALLDLSEQTMTLRPRWAAAGSVVIWRAGLVARAMSIPGVRQEAARSLAACAN